MVTFIPETCTAAYDGREGGFYACFGIDKGKLTSLLPSSLVYTTSLEGRDTESMLNPKKVHQIETLSLSSRHLILHSKRSQPFTVPHFHPPRRLQFLAIHEEPTLRIVVHPLTYLTFRITPLLQPADQGILHRFIQISPMTSVCVFGHIRRFDIVWHSEFRRDVLLRLRECGDVD